MAYNRVLSIWYQPETDDVQECVSIEMAWGEKRFLRIWPQSTDDGEPLLEWGSVVNQVTKEVHRNV